MAGDLHLAPDAAHHALLVDEVGCTLDSHIFPAIHALLDPDAVALADFALGVGGKDERKLVLLLEFVVRGYAVLRDADDHRRHLAEFREGVAEPAGFGRAARRVVLGIEIEHDLLAAQFGERDLAVAVGRQGEIRRFLTDLDTHDSCSSAGGDCVEGSSRARIAVAGASMRTSY